MLTMDIPCACRKAVCFEIGASGGGVGEGVGSSPVMLSELPERVVEL